MVPSSPGPGRVRSCYRYNIDPGSILAHLGSDWPSIRVSSSPGRVHLHQCGPAIKSRQAGAWPADHRALQLRRAIVNQRCGYVGTWRQAASEGADTAMPGRCMGPESGTENPALPSSPTSRLTIVTFPVFRSVWEHGRSCIEVQSWPVQPAKGRGGEEASSQLHGGAVLAGPPVVHTKEEQERKLHRSMRRRRSLYRRFIRGVDPNGSPHHCQMHDRNRTA